MDAHLIDVAMVDDHRFIVEALTQSFEQSGLVRVVGSAHSLEECRRMLDECSPRVLLLDVSLPDGNSIDSLADICEAHPEVRVLMLTSYAESSVVARAMAQGAAGYILKNSLSEEILEGVLAVAAGESFLCDEAGALIGRDDDQPVLLTRREREVLELIVEGYTCREISERIFLSYDTVHDYYKYLRLKLHANNTATLVRRAIEQKWV
ncbi:MAG: response regulator transcription factor [Alistipes sp.]|jgi:DNA-binding NarL/FixJ family response regulator|nr:response regulator transcription factor [Alistipes sp.]